MFDEVGRIEVSLELLAASGLCDEHLELVLVDDGSTDGTPDVAEVVLKELRLNGRIVRNVTNRGKGAAVRAGMLAAEGEARVFVDADLCVPTSDIERCFETLERGEADVVYGTRAHPDSALAKTQPPHRVASGRAFNLLLRSLALTSERDTQCGLKGATKRAVDVVYRPLVTERFAFDVEVLARAYRAGLDVMPLPVQWSHVEASRVRALRDGLDMARAAMRIRSHLAREAREAAAADMASDAVDAMAQVERDHWWFRAKRDLVVDELRRRDVHGIVVDVGAGTGGLLEQLEAGGRPAVGLEPDPHALELAGRIPSRPPVARAGAERVPVRDGAVGAVTALDVVEHLDDDVAGLRELARVAGPSGVVVVGVPAYRWAWSDHDVRLGHRRRYDRAMLRGAAEQAGLEVLRCSHYHSWLVPLALLLRRTPLRRLLRGSAEEASFVNPAVNRLLRAVSLVERLALRVTDLPAGLSILLVARAREVNPLALDAGGAGGHGSPTR
jgi:SAM-dependent methyltransferase